MSYVTRVLTVGGRVVIDDRYHDPSHAQEYRSSEWRKMLEALDFSVEKVLPYVKHRPLTSLTGEASSENARKIHEVITELGPHQRSALHLKEVNCELHLDHWYIMISARR